MPVTGTLYRADRLTRSFGHEGSVVEALTDVSFTIESGSFTAITGPSGSGKSTLLNLLGLLDTPSSGSLLIGGEDISTLSSADRATRRNRDIGFVFQSFQLLPRLTACGNVELPLLYGGIAKGQRHQQALRVLEKVGLGHRASHLPSQLSGGEQQRVAIARAIVNSPAVILADEPTGALDQATGGEIMALLGELHDTGTSVIIITHNAEIAARASHQISLVDGRILGAQP